PDPDDDDRQQRELRQRVQGGEVRRQDGLHPAAPPDGHAGGNAEPDRQPQTDDELEPASGEVLPHLAAGVESPGRREDRAGRGQERVHDQAGPDGAFPQEQARDQRADRPDLLLVELRATGGHATREIEAGPTATTARRDNHALRGAVNATRWGSAPGACSAGASWEANRGGGPPPPPRAPRECHPPKAAVNAPRL